MTSVEHFTIHILSRRNWFSIIFVVLIHTQSSNMCTTSLYYVLCSFHNLCKLQFEYSACLLIDTVNSC